MAYGGAVGDNGLDVLLQLDSTATAAPFGMVMSQQPDGSWRQLDIADGSLTSHIERLVATNESLRAVNDGGVPSHGDEDSSTCTTSSSVSVSGPVGSSIGAPPASGDNVLVISRDGRAS